jgi:hypothetical protein
VPPENRELLIEAADLDALLGRFERFAPQPSRWRRGPAAESHQDS